MQLFLLCVLLLLAVPYSWAATIHHVDSAVSHQSFTRVPYQAKLPSKLVLKPTFATPINQHIYEQESSHTPAHLTFSAHPVVHQMLPRIKPVRQITYASLLPGPRTLI